MFVNCRRLPTVSLALLLASCTVAAARAQESPAKSAVPTAAIPADRLGEVLAPKAFRAASQRVLPSLVTIEAFAGVATSRPRGIRLPGEGPTSGLIISSDGFIVTSTFNFLKKPPIITVVLPSGERKVARLLGRDETRKICLLKVDGVSDLPVPEFAPRAQLKVGQWAVALGVGFGDEDASLSAGIISATSRISGRAVQTDANLSPANYGGPLIDLEGRVIGICVPLNPQSKEVASGVEWYDSGIGFAVPLHGAEDLLTRLKAGETLQAGYLGIQAAPLPDRQRGAKVSNVVKGSPAEKAGLKKDDRIQAVAGDEVLDPAHMAVLVGRYVAGQEVKLSVLRGEEKIDLTAKLEVPPARQAPMPMPMVESAEPPGDEPMPREGPKPEGKKPDESKPEDKKPADPSQTAQ
jgi:serine protease Do